MGSINGTMDLYTKANGCKITYKAQVVILGQMEESIMGTGKITTWKEQVFTHGVMEGSMKENIKTTLKMVLEYIAGQMVENTKAGGTKVNNMAWANILMANQSVMVSGKMERNQNG